MRGGEKTGKRYCRTVVVCQDNHIERWRCDERCMPTFHVSGCWFLVVLLGHVLVFMMSTWRCAVCSSTSACSISVCKLADSSAPRFADGQILWQLLETLWLPPLSSSHFTLVHNVSTYPSLIAHVLHYAISFVPMADASCRVHGYHQASPSQASRLFTNSIDSLVEMHTLFRNSYSLTCLPADAVPISLAIASADDTAYVLTQL